MDEYIKKSTVLEEIDRRLKKYASSPEDDKLDAIYGGKCTELVSLFGYIDKLKGEEADLGKEYEEFVENDAVYRKLVNSIVGKSIAKHFFELGLKAQKGE